MGFSLSLSLCCWMFSSRWSARVCVCVLVCAGAWLLAVCWCPRFIVICREQFLFKCVNCFWGSCLSLSLLCVLLSLLLLFCYGNPTGLALIIRNPSEITSFCRKEHMMERDRRELESSSHNKVLKNALLFVPADNTNTWPWWKVTVRVWDSPAENTVFTGLACFTWTSLFGKANVLCAFFFPCCCCFIGKPISPILA